MGSTYSKIKFSKKDISGGHEFDENDDYDSKIIVSGLKAKMGQSAQCDTVEVLDYNGNMYGLFYFV